MQHVISLQCFITNMQTEHMCVFDLQSFPEAIVSTQINAFCGTHNSAVIKFQKKTISNMMERLFMRIRNLAAGLIDRSLATTLAYIITRHLKCLKTFDLI